MKRLLAGTAVLGLAVAGIGTATAAPAELKVTGGGQITTMDKMTGPGQTIAFNAQSAPTSEQADAARGQLQFNNHDGAKFHGTVTCLAAMPTANGDGTAVLGGMTDEATPRPFRIDVVDDGEGGDAQDMITLRLGTRAFDGQDPQDGTPGASTDRQLCDAETDPVDMRLGRGNVQVHKANG